MVDPTSRIRRPQLIAIALLALSTPLLGQRAQQPQFRAGTTAVPVYATVRNASKGFVLDLTKDDFEIRDEGRVVPITQFAIDVQPLSAVVLIDGSGSMLPEFHRAIEGASSFVLRMLADDRACIGSFADKIAFGPGFTSDRDALLNYMRDEFNLRMGYETHLWEAIAASSDVLREERGKRVVVVLSDGYNSVLPPGALSQPPAQGPGKSGPPIIGGPGGSPIGLGGRNPTGGTSGGPTSVGVGTPSIGDTSRNGLPLGDAIDAAHRSDTLVFAVSMWVRSGKNVTKPNADLEHLAVSTGGAFYRVRESEDMHAPFTDIMQQLRQQYVLGFVPTSLDGKKHKLEVRVKRGGVDVRARNSYIASADGR